MTKQGVTKIDIKQVLAQKAPKASRKIPGFIVDYLIRTVHQEELNDILTRYHDKEGVDFMRELIGYFDLTLDLVHAENIPTEGRYIFASNHPLGGLDGICLSAVIGSRFEGRIKYPVNDLLLYLSNLKSIFVPINKHGTQGKDNARMLEEAFPRTTRSSLSPPDYALARLVARYKTWSGRNRSSRRRCNTSGISYRSISTGRIPISSITLPGYARRWV